MATVIVVSPSLPLLELFLELLLLLFRGVSPPAVGSGGVVEDNGSVGLRDVVVATPGSEGIGLDGVGGIPGVGDVGEVGVGIKVSNKDTAGITAGFEGIGFDGDNGTVAPGVG